MSAHPYRVAGVLLSGGSSRRMGWDKTTLVVDGSNVVARTGGLLARVTSPVVEVGAGRSGLPVVLEDPPGEGPLAAVVTGWRVVGAGSEAALVVAGDLPFLTEELLRFLVRYPGKQSVVPVVAGRDQPLCARWSRVDLQRAEALRESGERSLRLLRDRPDVVYLGEGQWGGVATARQFVDVDTTDDLSRWGLDAPDP